MGRGDEMIAELKAAFAEIEAARQRKSDELLSEGFQLLAKGDRAGRDQCVQDIKWASECARQAMLQAGVIIGRKYGVSEDYMRRKVAEINGRMGQA